PVGLTHQMVRVAETKNVGRFAERDGFFRSRAQLAQQRVITRRERQFGQVARGGHVEHREPGGLHVHRMAHAKRFRLGVHRPDERRIAARVAMGQARRRAVFRGHQGNQQHVTAIQFTAQLDAGEHAFHLGG
nr:hypothetical protein [Tanacetum cinerariifolium]